MTFLLDVNLLIALVDPTHTHHDPVHAWFEASGQASWATCPVTENGLLRIVGHARYPNTPGSPAAVATILEGLRAQPGHVFWADDVSLLDTKWVNADRLLTHKQVTDTYLLALARTHGGMLASMDRRLVTDAVHGGKKALLLI